jgi:hypothetical protein
MWNIPYNVDYAVIYSILAVQKRRYFRAENGPFYYNEMLIVAVEMKTSVLSGRSV